MKCADCDNRLHFEWVSREDAEEEVGYVDPSTLLCKCTMCGAILFLKNATKDWVNVW